MRLFGTSRVIRQLRDKVRLFSTSRVVRHLRKHDGTKWDCLVPQMLSDNSTNSVGKVRLVSTIVRQLHKHDVTKWDCVVLQWLSQNFTNTMWDCLVPQGLSDNFTNTIGQSETVWHLKGCQTTSQARWDKVRLVSTSSVVIQLDKHDGTKWECLVHQGWSDNFTNTMGQS